MLLCIFMQPREFFQRTKLPLRKTYDQFYVNDDGILDYEIELADLQEKDVVLEIGAGYGNLTRKIAERCGVLAVEKDRRFLQFLWKIRNCVAIGNDVLKVLKDARDADRNPFNKIMGNVPYSISQKILLEIMKHEWDLAVMCVDEKIAEKISGRNNNKLGFLVQDCCDVEIKRKVPAERFYPRGVDSRIIVLKQKKKMDEEFWLFLQKIFRSRSRNLRNILDKCPDGFSQRKPSQLSLEEAKDLYERVRKKEK